MQKLKRIKQSRNENYLSLRSDVRLSLAERPLAECDIWHQLKKKCSWGFCFCFFDVVNYKTNYCFHSLQTSIRQGNTSHQNWTNLVEIRNNNSLRQFLPPQTGISASNGPITLNAQNTISFYLTRYQKLATKLQLNCNLF